MHVFKNNLVYLTGFMGSGKSTLAPILANTLGFESVDIDKEIEKEAGKKIAEIFEEYGEKYFRDAEQKLLQRASERECCVIALGGGTIAQGNKIQIIKSTGILIYLYSSPEEIFRRLKHKTDRPLLMDSSGKKPDEKELRSRIVTLLKQREPYYNQADIVVETGKEPVGRTIDEIVRRLDRLKKQRGMRK